ncbi:MAG TPA: hypothetical protein VLH10_17025 [Yinghuangia sp.]|nr:hypothetical protein [Yinghuangia sp.]
MGTAPGGNAGAPPPLGPEDGGANGSWAAWGGAAPHAGHGPFKASWAPQLAHGI